MNTTIPQIIHASGGIEPVYPANGKIFSLEELQQIVGGHIEMVALHDGRMMTLNEEGKLLDLPFNPLATGLFNNPPRMMFDPIAGDVLICYGNWLEADESDDEFDERDGQLIDRASTDAGADEDEYDDFDDYDDEFDEFDAGSGELPF